MDKKWKAASHARAVYERNIEEGRCVKNCGRDAIPGKSTCPECREVQRKRARAQWARNRAAVIQHYGGKCGCCGEDRPEFLQIDHDWDGWAGSSKGKNMTHLAVTQGFPDDFRLRCANCNVATRWGRVCPHQRK